VASIGAGDGQWQFGTVPIRWHTWKKVASGEKRDEEELIDRTQRGEHKGHREKGRAKEPMNNKADGKSGRHHKGAEMLEATWP
jgi:hypothetical protein